ncbi:hypothetical protein HDE_02196 [Halotydeus destructor]|nr:hypothetical protein HDE_02196 [Halotydeus destructor]
MDRIALNRSKENSALTSENELSCRLNQLDMNDDMSGSRTFPTSAKLSRSSGIQKKNRNVKFIMKKPHVVILRRPREPKHTMKPVNDKRSFAFIGISDKMSQIALLSELGGNVSTSVTSASHVVVRPPLRDTIPAVTNLNKTLFLQAVAAGKHLVNESYLVFSAREGHYLDEEKFTLMTSGSLELEFMTLVNSAKRFRRKRSVQNKRLIIVDDRYKFYSNLGHAGGAKVDHVECELDSQEILRRIERSKLIADALAVGQLESIELFINVSSMESDKLTTVMNGVKTSRRIKYAHDAKYLLAFVADQMISKESYIISSS